MSKIINITFCAGRVYDPDGEEWTVGTRRKLGLGEMELRETPRAGLHMVRFSAGGNFVYSLPLRREGIYRLGASYGHRVRQPSEEQDPILRVLRERDIPVSCLRRQESSAPLRAEAKITSIELAYPAGSCRWDWISDGDREIVAVDPEDPGRQEIEITQATWAIQLIERVALNGAIRRFVGSVIVWPDCDPAALAAGLDRILSVSSARKRRTEKKEEEK